MIPYYPPLIAAPEDSGQWSAWRAELEAWRVEARKGLNLAAYDRPEFAWARDCVMCAKVMLFDREFYDPVRNRFRVEEYVARMRRDFGGLDALVLWQAYPRIGFDARNQYDHYRFAPGLKEVVDTLHRLDVRAVMAYNPWDVGTRREKGPDSEEIARVVREFGFDGVFLDTLNEGQPALRAALDRARPGVIMESELALPLEGVPDHHASWAQWLDDGEAPGVLRNRWVERRHMLHLIRRWDLDHSGELHLAWMNGAGILVWENVFGSWNGWNDRDKALLRSMLPIRRRYAELFDAGEWRPLVSCTLDDVYASRWSLGGVTLWTLVNRRRQAVSGAALPVASDGATRLFDLVRGVELDHADLEFPGRWIGALLALPSRLVDDAFQAFLRDQAVRFKEANQPATRIEPQIVRTVAPFAHAARVSEGMVSLKPGPRVLVSRFRARECGEYGGAPMPNFVYPDLHFERRVEHRITLGHVAVDRREVTNREFLKFVRRSGYRPSHADSMPARAADDRPAVFVTLDDARAYAKWAGKRLPTEHEWQAAVAEHALPTGEVWNWTESEHDDGHTRFSILKGGCHWEAKGSPWYADGAPRPADFSAKYIHFFPALDRAETIGFRCAVDL